MGWLWSSSSGRPDISDNGQQEQQASALGVNEARQERTIERSGVEASQSQSNRTGREEQADAELDAFLRSLSSAGSTDPASTSEGYPSSPSTGRSEYTQPKTYDRYLPDGSINIHPDAIYPVTMSCRQAFDQAFYCQSLGGKFNDIYRFGHLKDCSEQWGAFWFCMRNRTLPAKDKEGQIREYYRARDERKRKEFGSSEDIWKIREKALTSAFGKDPDAESDAPGVLIKE